MLSRPRTQASQEVGDRRGVNVPKPTGRRPGSGSAANLRIVSSEPSRASGGMTALTRLPSGSRASTIGLDSSTRRPTRPTILSIVRRRWASSVNCPSTLEDPAAALDVDRVGAVDHDLGDVRVAQEGLDRPVAEDVVGDLLGDPGAVGDGQRRLVLGEHLLQRQPDLLLELGLGQPRVVQLRARGSRAAPGGRCA